MKIAAFRHVPDEPLGYLETVFAGRGIPFAYHDLFETNEVVPGDATHLIFLGGPMSVNDEHEYPFLKEEKDLIRTSVRRKQKVLGICLGAQLIASAYGAKVYRFVPEIGWRSLRKEDGARGGFEQFPAIFPVFQLHGETFEIPYGGKLLASGDVVRNQAFRIKNALGLQFHLELTESMINDWSRGLSRHQQNRIRRETPRYLPESNRLCRLVAGDFTGP
ncbi:MAG: type 1 glutamine amidotransferase [Methanoregula sp.]|jgi:GMP synthase-like glutamine amidotransferase|uniref:type 1 glutamine amidotransferase n=1 Tax=Methanoregula sp. TaxID=2052170 RepID=UPI003D0B9D12